jgi:hypothetical protein
MLKERGIISHKVMNGVRETEDNSKYSQICRMQIIPTNYICMISAGLNNVGLRSVLKLFCCLILMLQKASLPEPFWHYFGYHRIIFLSEEFMKAVRGKMEVHV